MGRARLCAYSHPSFALSAGSYLERFLVLHAMEMTVDFIGIDSQATTMPCCESGADIHRFDCSAPAVCRASAADGTAPRLANFNVSLLFAARLPCRRVYLKQHEMFAR